MGDKSSVLFLHPIVVGRRSAHWLDVPDMLAPDLPGHGQRAIPRDGLTLDEIADEIAGWIHEPVHVVGALMGGTIGMHLALNHPRLVRSLVVSDTGSKTDRVGMIERSRIVANGDRQLDWTLQRWFGAETMARDPLPEPVAYARDALAGIPLQTLSTLWRAMADHDVVDELSAITVPVTVVAGRHDVVHPIEQQEALSRAFPHGRLLAIDAHHMAPLDNPSEFSRAVRDHIGWAESQATDTRMGRD